MTAPSATLPLLCSVCPKKPSFSDVSHLLTHIGSKAHLSHYYKLRVRSVKDPIARNILAIFDAWYSSHDVEGLMSARMSDKNKKRSRARAQATMAPQPAKRARAVPEEQPSIDPRLNPVFSDFKFGSGLDQAAQALEALQSPFYHPRLHLWSTKVPSSYEAIPLHGSSPLIPCYHPASDETLSYTSTSHGTVDSLVTDDSAKLKGIQWPGMDVFDSATENMKRMRNQRKDTSVLVKLEQNSLMVQPTETIYFPFGHLKKSRPITGKADPNSTSPSPTLSALSLPRPSKTSKRRPFADRSTNSAHFLEHAGLDESRDLKSATKAISGSKRLFPVYRDRQSIEPAQSTMPVLTSSFQLSAQFESPTASSLVPAHVQLPAWSPPQIQTQSHMTLMEQTLPSHLSFDGHPPLFQDHVFPPDEHNYWTPTAGYDLSTFYSHHARRYSPSRCAPHHRDTQFVAALEQEHDATQALSEDAKISDGSGQDMFFDMSCTSPLFNRDQPLINSNYTD